MNDIEQLSAPTSQLINVLSPWMQHVRILDWDGTQGFAPILKRSAIIRQFDALKVILKLVSDECGYAAVPLLRAACEELLWLSYFHTLSTDDSKLLAELLVKRGLLEDLEAQAGEVGADVMQELGLLAQLQFHRTQESAITDKLKELGKRLSWPKNRTVPSTWFIAKATNSEKLYSFLYHATSRYVHFSPVELGRRGWGRPGRLEIASEPYERIWALFSLSWGTRLFGLTLNAVLEDFVAQGVPEPDHKGLQTTFEAIADVPLIPIITPEELVWQR